MELDLEGELADRAYPILASLVVPRPIALITTISPEGKVTPRRSVFSTCWARTLRSWPLLLVIGTTPHIKRCYFGVLRVGG